MLLCIPVSALFLYYKICSKPDSDWMKGINISKRLLEMEFTSQVLVIFNLMIILSLTFFFFFLKLNKSPKLINQY